jgi:SAM-dependent methyltransferase/ribosomal protein S18 acetylase RimI-like enzyme
VNRQSYDGIATQWDEARTSFVGNERGYLELLLERVPTPASILDVGCGTGRPMAEFVLARGHRITGVDQSEELLTIARQRFPDATWLHARIEDFHPEAGYDGVICWDALFHVERAHHEGILSRLYECLVPGGRIMFTVGGSANPPFTDTMFGHEFFYDSHPPQHVSAMLLGLGYELLVNEYMDLPMGGRDKGRVAIVAEKPSIVLERATPDDARAFADMEQAADTGRYIMGYSHDEHVRRLADPSLIYLRIVDAGQLAGFFILALDPDGASVEFRRIVVTARGRGIGQAAIRRMELFCQAVLGRSRIWLDVFEDNLRGRHIYEKLGYARFGESIHGERRLLLYEKLLERMDALPSVPPHLEPNR